MYYTVDVFLWNDLIGNARLLLVVKEDGRVASLDSFHIFEFCSGYYFILFYRGLRYTQSCICNSIADFYANITEI